MSDKKPQSGEWWKDLRDNQIVNVVIVTAIDELCVREKGGRLGVWRLAQFALNYEHLPDCDSFDWQPETFPQYWTTIDCKKDPGAYVIRTSTDQFRIINKDGSTQKHIVSWYPEDSKDRTRITQAEAESLVKKPEPVESPDDWVTQDRVPARVGIDSEHWSNWGVDEWHVIGSKQISAQRKMMHGNVDEQEDTLSLRCRRRDLPPLPQETPKRDYVRLFQAKGGMVCTAVDVNEFGIPELWRELKHDGTGFYLEDGK